MQYFRFKSLRKRPLDRREIRMHDNDRIDLTELRMDWTELF